MIAEIIAAGSEMLTPFRQDTNSLYLTEGLNDLGVSVAFKTIVGDNLDQLTNVARTAFSRAGNTLRAAGVVGKRNDVVWYTGSMIQGMTYRIEEEPANAA